MRTCLRYRGFTDKERCTIKTRSKVIIIVAVLLVIIAGALFFVWKNMDNVVNNQPYAAKIVSTEPVSASAVRYVYGLRGLEEWGMQVHSSMYGVPGPVIG